MIRYFTILSAVFSVFVPACRAPGAAGDSTASGSAISAPPPPLDTSWERPASQPLAAGDRAPDFEGIAHTGMRVRLSALLDAPVVVYFYGADRSPDAKAVAEGFRGLWLRFRERASMVLGVSADDRVTHRDFATAEELPFLLVADDQNRIARAFGVPVENGRNRAATFVVGKDGRVMKALTEVTPVGHADVVFAALEGAGR